jgi:O-antigen/teichoic acid export membrane protein
MQRHATSGAQRLSGWRLPARITMLLGFAGTSLINYGFGLAAGWLLAPGDFGLLAFSQTLLLIGGLILNSGFPWSLTAVLAGGASERGALVRGALHANMLLALALGVLIAALMAAGPLQRGLESWAMAALVMGALPALSVVAIGRAVAQSAERFELVALIQVGEVGIKTLVGVTLLALGQGPLGGIAGFVAGAWAVAALASWLLAHKLGVALRGPWIGVPTRLSSGMFGALLGTALVLNLDLLVLKLVGVGRDSVGHYQAALVLANLPYYLASALIPIVFTQIAQLQRLAASSRIVGEALRLTLLMILPLEVALIAAPEQIIAMFFPATYLPSAAVIRMLALGNCALILLAPVITAFQASGQAALAARTMLALALAELLLLLALVPRLGDTAAAAIFMLTAGLALLLLSAKYSRAVVWRGASAGSGRWLARYVLSLGPALALALVVLRGGHHLALAALVGGGWYGMTAYLTGLLYRGLLLDDVTHEEPDHAHSPSGL